MHLTKGMMKSIRVMAQANPADRPRATAEIRLSDYAFALSSPLESGRNVVRFVNEGPQVHEVGLVKLDPGVTTEQFLSTFRPRPAPGTLRGQLLGGVSLLSAGYQVLWPVTLESGAYVLLCFVPDAEDGRPHLAHGMVREFAIRD